MEDLLKGMVAVTVVALFAGLPVMGALIAIGISAALLKIFQIASTLWPDQDQEGPEKPS